jgi:hypothetical protein
MRRLPTKLRPWILCCFCCCWEANLERVLLAAAIKMPAGAPAMDSISLSAGELIELLMECRDIGVSEAVIGLVGPRTRIHTYERSRTRLYRCERPHVSLCWVRYIGKFVCVCETLQLRATTTPQLRLIIEPLIGALCSLTRSRIRTTQLQCIQSPDASLRFPQICNLRSARFD